MDGTENSSWVPWPTFSDEPPPIGDLDDDEDDYGGFTSASDTVFNSVSPHPVNNQPPLPSTISTGKEVMVHLNIEDLSKEIDALSKEFSSDGQVLSFPEDIPSPDSTTVEAYPYFPNVTSPHEVQEPSNLISNSIEDDFGDFATPEPPSQIASHPSPDSMLQINPLDSHLSSSSELTQTQKTTTMGMITPLPMEGVVDTSSKGRKDSFFSDISNEPPVTVPTGNEDYGWGDFSSSDPSSSVPPPSGEQVATASSQWEANFGHFEEFKSSAEVESNFPAQTHGHENDDFGDFSGPVSLDTTTTTDSGGVFLSAGKNDIQSQNTSDDTFGDFNSATQLTEDTQQQQKTTDTFAKFSSRSSALVQDGDDFGDFTSSTVKQDDVSDSFGGFSSATVGGNSTNPPTSVAATIIPPATSSAISLNLQDFKTLLEKHYPEPERSSSEVKPDSYWSISLHSQVSSQNSLWLTAQASSSVQGVLFQWENSETQDNFFVSTHVDPAMAPATVSRQIKSALQLGDFTSILRDPSSPTSPTSSQSSIANVLLDLSFQPTLASPAREEIVLDEDLLGLDFSLSVQPPQPSLSSSSANTEGQSTAETQSDDFGDFSTAPVKSLAETTSDPQPSNSGEQSTLKSISTTFPAPDLHQEGEDDFGDFSSAVQSKQTDSTLHTSEQTTASSVANLLPLHGTNKGEMMRENLYGDFSSAVDMETISSVKEKEVTFDANFSQSLNSQLQPVRDDTFGDFLSGGTSEDSAIFSAPVANKPILPTTKASSDLLATSLPHSFSSTDTKPLPETSTFPSHTEAPKDYFGLSNLTSKVATSELKVSKDDDFFGDFSSAEIPQQVVTSTAMNNATETKTSTDLFGNVQPSTGIPTTSGVDRTVHVFGDFFTETKQPPSLIPVNVQSNLSPAAAGTPLVPALSPQTQVMTETTGNSGWTVMKSNGMTMTGSANVTMIGSSTVNETGNGRVTLTGSTAVNETGSGRVTMTGSSGPLDQTWASDEGWASSLPNQLIGTNFSGSTTQQSGVLSSSAVGDDDFGDFAGAPLKQSLVTNPPSIQVVPNSSYNQLTNVTSQVANSTPNFPAFGMEVGMNEANLSVSNPPQSSSVADPYKAFSDFNSFRSSQLSSDRITMSSPTRLSPEAQRLLDRIPDVRFMLSDVRLPAQSSI